MSLDTILQGHTQDAYFLSAISFHNDRIEDLIIDAGPTEGPEDISIIDHDELSRFDIELIEKAREFRAGLRGSGVELISNYDIRHSIPQSLSVMNGRVYVLSIGGGVGSGGGSSMSHPLLKHSFNPNRSKTDDLASESFDLSPEERAQDIFWQQGIQDLLWDQKNSYLYFWTKTNNLYFAHPSVDDHFIRALPSINGIVSIAMSETQRSTDDRAELLMAAAENIDTIHMSVINEGRMHENHIQPLNPIHVGESGIIQNIKLSPFGKYLAIRRLYPIKPYADQIDVINVATHEVVFTKNFDIDLSNLETISRGLSYFKFMSTDHLLYLGMRNGNVGMVNLDSPKEENYFIPAPSDSCGPVLSIAESSDFSLAVSYANGSIKIWPSPDKNNIVIQKTGDGDESDYVVNMKFVSDTTLASLSQDGLLQIWDLSVPKLDLNLILLVDPTAADMGGKK